MNESMIKEFDTIGTDTKVSKEFIEDKALLLSFIQDNVVRFKNQLEGSQPIVFFFTFMNDDYERKLLTFRCVNKEVKYIYITAPQCDIKEALEEITTLNKHLKFKEKPFLGWNADDFVYNKITARVEIDWN